jgi:hypothetical protein
MAAVRGGRAGGHNGAEEEAETLCGVGCWTGCACTAPEPMARVTRRALWCRRPRRRRRGGGDWVATMGDG